MIELTKALAHLCLDVYERRLRFPPLTVFGCTLLEEALLIQAGAMTPVYRDPPRRAYAGGLKRPNWKHEKGDRG